MAKRSVNLSGEGRGGRQRDSPEEQQDVEACGA